LRQRHAKIGRLFVDIGFVLPSMLRQGAPASAMSILNVTISKPR
jgi:hypothetical protein